MRKYLLRRIAAISAAVGLLLCLNQGRWFGPWSVHAEKFPAPPVKRLEVRNREAQKVVSVLQTLDARHAEPEDPGPKFKISESELNSYLSYVVEKENVAGVDSFFVKLQEGSFIAYAVVNVDDIPRKDRDPATRLLMETVLAGRRYISAEGSLTVQNGVGQFILTAARIDQAAIPPGIVNALINVLGRKQTPPFDLTRPFKPPFRIREAQVKPGYLEIS